jgi:Ca-activated chloride channel homolog
MSIYDTSPADLYRKGVAHFNNGEWAAAIEALSALQETGAPYRDVDQLLADAQLKLQFEGGEVPVALAPPRPSLMMPVLMGVALLLLVVGGFLGFQWLNRPQAVVAVAAPTAPPATATPRPVATARPTAVVVAPTPIPRAPGTVAIKAAEGESFISTPANIDIILDASGSMLAPVGTDGPERWVAARDALRSLLDSGVIPLESYVGVRTYGRNRGRDCGDIEVMQPLEPYSYERVLGVVNAIKPVPYGMTPLAASLRNAGQNLANVTGSSAVILVTDGIESCDGDPVAEAEKLVAGATDRKVHVIGFAIDDPAATENLRQIAAKGNGLYFDANDSAQLGEALQQAVVLSYAITTPSGEEVATGTVGDAPVPLNAGAYRLRIEGTPLVQDFAIKNGDTTEILLSQGNGGLQAETVAGR